VENKSDPVFVASSPVAQTLLGDSSPNVAVVEMPMRTVPFSVGDLTNRTSSPVTGRFNFAILGVNNLDGKYRVIVPIKLGSKLIGTKASSAVSFPIGALVKTFSSSTPIRPGALVGMASDGTQVQDIFLLKQVFNLISAHSYISIAIVALLGIWIYFRITRVSRLIKKLADSSFDIRHDAARDLKKLGFTEEQITNFYIAILANLYFGRAVQELKNIIVWLAKPSVIRQQESDLVGYLNQAQTSLEIILDGQRKETEASLSLIQENLSFAKKALAILKEKKGDSQPALEEDASSPLGALAGMRGSVMPLISFNDPMETPEKYPFSLVVDRTAVRFRDRVINVGSRAKKLIFPPWPLIYFTRAGPR
jgi:hypothetical protein